MTETNLTEQATASLALFKDPETGRPLSQTGQVRKLDVVESKLSCVLGLSTHSMPIKDEVVERLTSHFQARVPGITSIDIQIETFDRPAPTIGQVGLKVKSVIAVGSGKGGVGKSTVAASIALMLERLGAKVGLMDADVYGPSVPHLLGISGRPEVVENKIKPIRCGSMPVMSMGFLVEPDQAVIWRGPMLHGSITQFLRDTLWGELDYLIIDMPPGTGDIALTLSQLLPLAGSVVVCTPQEVALLDAVKAIAMFRKVKIPLLGMVENMSGFICPDCGKRYDIFGHGGAREKAEQLDVPFLGDIPLNISLRQQSDGGQLPAALNDPINSVPLEKITKALVRSLSDMVAAKPSPAALPVLG